MVIDRIYSQSHAQELEEREIEIREMYTHTPLLLLIRFTQCARLDFPSWLVRRASQQRATAPFDLARTARPRGPGRGCGRAPFDSPAARAARPAPAPRPWLSLKVYDISYCILTVFNRQQVNTLKSCGFPTV